MLETVSISRIIGMAVSFVIAVGLPVGAFIFWKKHSDARWINVLVGAVTFLLFALVLESTLHRIVLGKTGETITGKVWLYALYGGLCAGIIFFLQFSFIS